MSICPCCGSYAREPDREVRFLPGSRAAIVHAIEITIDAERPLGIDADLIKREVAFIWLERPRGLWERLRWALRLARLP